jgi:transcriptional regulator with XRE-family HTH domain
MTVFASRLGLLLRERRGERTQIDVAGAIGLSDSSYSAYERGVALPTIETLVRLLVALGIGPDELLALLYHDDEPNDVAA